MSRVQDIYPDYQEMEKQRQLDVLREIGPHERYTTGNTTCVQGHQWAVDGLDASQPDTPPIRLLAVGRDSTAPAEGDLSLGDEVDRIDVTGYDDNGSSIVLSTVLGAQEGNVDVGAGEALREVGLYAGGVDGETTYFLNHSLLPVEIDKDDTITATIDCTLTYDAV